MRLSTAAGPSLTPCPPSLLSHLLPLPSSLTPLSPSVATRSGDGAAWGARTLWRRAERHGGVAPLVVARRVKWDAALSLIRWRTVDPGPTRPDSAAGRWIWQRLPMDGSAGPWTGSTGLSTCCFLFPFFYFIYCGGQLVRLGKSFDFLCP